MSEKNRRIVLAARPVGEIKDSDFRYEEVEPQQPGDGEVLLRNCYLSLDPAMRGWMNDRKSYVPPVQIGEAMRGGTISQVVASNAEGFAPGDLVHAMGGWQDYAVISAADSARLMKLPADTGLPPSYFLSVLGITGLTAYFGLLDVGEPKAGETVVVSTAAGAVGSVVGQIAKLKGCRVVGTAGDDDKCAWCRDELGFDAMINYKTEDAGAALDKHCPQGIDIYFDNVGGELLDLCLARIRRFGRVVICGAITQYNKTAAAPGPQNYLQLLIRSARMQGFIVIDYADRFMEGVMQLAQWVMQGQLKHREHVVDGLENAPRAIHMLFDGSNRGKLMVKIADPESR